MSFGIAADIMDVFEREIIGERRAMEKSDLTACIVVDNREDGREQGDEVYRDTPLPFAGRLSGTSSQRKTADNRDAAAERDVSAGRDVVLERNVDTKRSSSIIPGEQSFDVPEPILQMIRLYEFGDGSPSHRARMFCLQGRFMEQYEDNFPWQGDFHRYFTTYHDLNIRQLRGYFTWRTGIRNGIYRPISTSLAYMYLYELLCGIGASSADDVLQKMKVFEENYVDSGIGDPGMRKNIRRWMFEYAVLHGLPSEMVLPYASPEALDFDHSLAALRNPAEYTEEDIFRALSRFTGGSIGKSSVLTRDRERTIHLFAGVWKYLSEHFEDNGRDIFTVCFGERKCYPWHPLSNAVYWEESEAPDTDFILDACRSYHLRGGKWQEERYGGLNFHPDWLRSLLRAADRIFRRYLKTGHYLQERKDEEWAVPHIEAALQEMQAEERRAAMPVIDIDYSGLDQIREDAAITRDSLLTEEETEESREPEISYTYDTESREPEISCTHDTESREPKTSGESDTEATAARTNRSSDIEATAARMNTDSVYRRILLLLLDGNSVNDVVRENHLMPSVVTDAVNEAFFDEIGDNVLECEGAKIRIVEDYREDLLQVLEKIRL